MIRRLKPKSLTLTALFFLAMTAACSSGLQRHDAAPYPVTTSYQQIFTSMEVAREQAIAENKLVLYVMGANWCHDSVGFVDKTQTPEFSALIEERYVVELIDVGAMEYIREVITRYDEPIIYGSPTVLVVEPETNILLNRSTLPYWRNADAISLDDTLAYFSEFNPGQHPETSPIASPALAAALADIDAFENTQAERIYQAYQQLGKMMKEATSAKPSRQFQLDWRNLAEFRNRITEDLANLRVEAAKLDSQSVSPIELQFPEYELFIDD